MLLGFPRRNHLTPEFLNYVLGLEDVDVVLVGIKFGEGPRLLSGYLSGLSCQDLWLW